jgi:hypothetical protein
MILLLSLAVLSAGCTSPAAPAAPATAAPTSVPVPAAPVQTTTVPMITTNLPSGVTISYPADWERQDVLTSGVRDYGKDTVNIANFFSPNVIPGDTRSYDSLSIDLDRNVAVDFDTYFNQATLAVGKTYGTQMEAHSYTIKIGGYDSYELDFLTKDVKGTYIFTKVDGSIYIFAFKGPNKPLVITALSDEIVGIYKSIQLNPTTTPVPKQR